MIIRIAGEDSVNRQPAMTVNSYTLDVDRQCMNISESSRVLIALCMQAEVCISWGNMGTRRHVAERNHYGDAAQLGYAIESAHKDDAAQKMRIRITRRPDKHKPSAGP